MVGTVAAGEHRGLLGFSCTSRMGHDYCYMVDHNLNVNWWYRGSWTSDGWKLIEYNATHLAVRALFLEILNELGLIQWRTSVTRSDLLPHFRQWPLPD